MLSLENSVFQQKKLVNTENKKPLHTIKRNAFAGENRNLVQVAFSPKIHE